MTIKVIEFNFTEVCRHVSMACPMHPDRLSRPLPAGALPAPARHAVPNEGSPVPRSLSVDLAGAQVSTTDTTQVESLRRVVMAMGSRLRNVAERAECALERAERRITDGFRVPPGGG